MQFLNNRPIFLLIAGAAMSLPGLLMGSPGYSGALIYDSKYISEGRDNLEEGGLVSVAASMHWASITHELWYARGRSTDYDELNLGLEYRFTFRDVDAYIGYTRLEFFEDNASDDEFGMGLASEVFAGITVELDSVYSLEAEGAFVEICIRREFQVEDTDLTLGVYVSEGFDFGYATSAYDGPNHFQTGLEASYQLDEEARLFAAVAHSFAHEDVKRDGHGDVSWYFIGLVETF